MADNDITHQGKPLAFKDRSDVRHQVVLNGSGVAPLVVVAAVTTSSVTPAVPSRATRREMILRNTGTTRIEVSPTGGFAWGAGMPLDPGEPMTVHYNGDWFARTETGTGQLRAYSED